ncbi:glycosyltransferase family 4 protein [Pseudidiomarina terrestris]|uniref:glycosyltransferase family 4 protein n=1 Tax=Pseudidiomarina terrestris TaxID=2820060 RepID=UPI00264EA4AB|nr:glycosyltransferase family 4 protein [Pseudidiomarina sp. 1ASP75-5]MDN7134539.1 glycosyltransferase family 4 protein [Pseudidiomarina sp. 1ASP75-5]
MKIAHLCLAAIYVEGYAYQENILPRIHKTKGHEVKIIASTETYLANRQLGYTVAKTFLNEDSIPVTRLNYVRWLPKKFVRKLRLYNGLEDELDNFNPDIIFLHDAQFWNTGTVARYVRSNPQVKVFSDCHTDFINSAKGFLSEKVLHRIIYRYYISRIQHEVKKFYGVTPPRCEFLIDVYKIPRGKVEYLPLGYDDSRFSPDYLRSIRKETRVRNGIPQDRFIIGTGGKFDDRKRLDLLVQACNQLGENLLDQIAIVLFGEPPASNAEAFSEIVDSSLVKIVYLGWQSPEQVSSIIASSDLMVFPGTHSTLWEESLGLGIPAILRYWDGFDKLVDPEKFLTLTTGTVEELSDKIQRMLIDHEAYQVCLSEAKAKSCMFQYSDIAIRALGDEMS